MVLYWAISVVEYFINLLINRQSITLVLLAHYAIINLHKTKDM
jgi:hypothetical protein